MKRLWMIVVFVGLLAAALGTAQANADSCNLDGVWYGFNTFGEDFPMTITNTGGGHYTAVVINPNTSAQGEFVFKRRGEYETTWLTYVDGEPFGYTGQWLAVYMTGDVEMTSCDSWSAASVWDVHTFTPGTGQDPFANPPVDSIPVSLFYTRIP